MDQRKQEIIDGLIYAFEHTIIKANGGSIESALYGNCYGRLDGMYQLLCHYGSGGGNGFYARSNYSDGGVQNMDIFYATTSGLSILIQNLHDNYYTFEFPTTIEAFAEYLYQKEKDILVRLEMGILQNKMHSLQNQY